MAYRIEFRQSGKTVERNEGKWPNLLECAEKNGVEIDSACREGYCGTCKIKLLSGEVEMSSSDGLQEEDIAENMILACVSVPKSDIIVNV